MGSTQHRLGCMQPTGPSEVGEFYTIDQVARKIGMHPSALRRLIRSGNPPAPYFIVGERLYRFPKGPVDALVAGSPDAPLVLHGPTADGSEVAS